MINLRQVTKVYDGKHRVTALRDVSLTVPPGELVGITGPSGSGKTTLLNLIGGLDQATSGEVRVGGRLLNTLSDDELSRYRRETVGIIFQSFHLLPTLSCRENVAMPLHLSGWPRRKVDVRTRELLSLVQLDHRCSHLPEELSGGERQRVAIARALAANPPVLLADEPVGNLDTQTGADILDLIGDIHARLGATVLIVTHEPSVARMCNRTIILRDGSVVGDEMPAAQPSGF